MFAVTASASRPCWAKSTIAAPGVKIALIDASRRNPFERRFRSFSAGLAPVIAPNGTLVMYSAALSSVISDNGGDHSLFVQELLKEIRVPDLMAEETLNRTRVGVTRASRSEQVPWISSSLAEDFRVYPGFRRDGGPQSQHGPSASTSAARTTKPPVALEYASGTATAPAPHSEPAPDRTPSLRHCHSEPPAPPQFEPPAAEAARIRRDAHDQTSTRTTARALGDDPIIKDLNDKLARDPDDANALLPTRAGLCQQGRLYPCHQRLLRTRCG